MQGVDTTSERINTYKVILSAKNRNYLPNLLLLSYWSDCWIHLRCYGVEGSHCSRRSSDSWKDLFFIKKNPAISLGCLTSRSLERPKTHQIHHPVSRNGAPLPMGSPYWDRRADCSPTIAALFISIMFPLNNHFLNIPKCLLQKYYMISVKFLD